VVVQVAADPGRVDDDVNPELLEVRARTDTRAKQYRGGVEGASREHDLVGPYLLQLPVPTVTDADGAAVLDDDRVHLAPGPDLQRVADRLEVRHPGVDATWAAHRDLLLRDAVEVVAVVVRVVLEPLLDGGCDDRLLDGHQWVVVGDWKQTLSPAQLRRAAAKPLDGLEQR